MWCVSTTWVTRCGERVAWIGEMNEGAGSKLLMLAVLSRLVFSHSAPLLADLSQRTVTTQSPPLYYCTTVLLFFHFP